MESIFDNSKCTDCKKFLSVFPIKLYPHNVVKCGRCNADDHDGTVSKLFQTIGKELRFPCNNRFEGCSETRRPKDVVFHENVCKGTIVTCPICNSFEGAGFALVEHFKAEHRDCYLTLPVFLVSLGDNIQEKYYLYADDVKNILGIIYVYFDYIVNKLYVNVSRICIETIDKKALTQHFELYSVDNRSLYRSSESVCFTQPYAADTRLNGVYVAKKTIDNVVMCKIFITEKKQIRLTCESSIPPSKNDERPEGIREVYKLNISNNNALRPVRTNHELNWLYGNPIMTFLHCENNKTHTIGYTFRDVHLLNKISTPIFYVENISWMICVKQCTIKDIPYLSVSLHKVDNKIETGFSYIVNAAVRILSYLEINNVEGFVDNHIFGKRPNETMEWEWSDLIEWSRLLDTERRFMDKNEDHIQVEVDITLVDILEHENGCLCVGCKH